MERYPGRRRGTPQRFARNCLLFLISQVPHAAQGTLHEVPEGEGMLQDFIQGKMEPLHAVAVGVVAKGSKKAQLLQELSEDEQLKHLLVFGIMYSPSGSTTLVVHRQDKPGEAYHDKWTRGAMSAWLLQNAYPPVNRITVQFAPQKYFHRNPFGLVLIAVPLNEQRQEFIEVLEPLAEKYKSKLKFTFITKVSSTESVCKMAGVLGNNELVIIEKPQEVTAARRAHSHIPSAPKYRMEGLSADRIQSFFQDYEARRLQRYFLSAEPAPLQPKPGALIRDLTGWDFTQVVEDPRTAVIVEFVSADCDACLEFDAPYTEVARRVQAAKAKSGSVFKKLIVARIDQSVNEHSELIKGTPWMKFWPTGRRKRPLDVELRNVDHILDFLEEKLSEDADNDNDEDPPPRKKKSHRKGAKPGQAPKQAAAQSPAASKEASKSLESFMGDEELEL